MKKRDISVKFLWIEAYCVVVLLMSLCFFVGIMLIQSASEKSAIQENQEKMNTSSSFLDKELGDALRYGIQIFCGSSAKNIENSDFVLPEERQQAYNLSCDMGNYIVSNPIVEDYYLYYPKSQYIVGSRGVYRDDDYWTLLYYNNQLHTYDEWKSQLFASRAPGYFMVEHEHGFDIYYRMSDNLNNGRILVAKLNSKEVSAVLEWIRGSRNNSFFAVIDDADYVFASAGNDDQFICSQENSLEPVDEKKFLYTEQQSSVPFLRYVTITEKDSVYFLSNNIKTISFICLIMTFVGGIWLVIFFTKKNIKPVQEIAMKLSKGDSTHKNELREIELQLDHLMYENQMSIQNMLRHKNMIVSRSFLNECFRSSLSELLQVETLAAIYNLTFEYSNYCLVVLKRSDKNLGDQIYGLVSSWDNEYSTVYWTEQQDLAIFLINYEYLLEEQEQPHEIFFAYLRTIVDRNAELVISSETNNLEDIRSCYLECIRKLQKMRIPLPEGQNGDSSVSYDEFQGKAVLASFIQYIKNMDLIGAQKIVPELCDKYLVCESKLERECRQYHVIQQILYLPEARALEGELAKFRDYPPDVWKVKLSVLLEDLAKKKRLEDSAAYESDVARKIQAIIEEEYANPAIDLRFLSEAIGMSQAHISRMFKKKFGVGVSQYLNKIRIAHAKELMNHGGLSIKAIALQVGYSSDVQFIRVFKKFENTTPGTFRSSGGLE